MAFCATDENEHGEFVARAGISTINMYAKTTLWCSGIMQCLALSKVTRWSNAGVRASSVHDHFGNSVHTTSVQVFRQIRNLDHFGTCKWSTTSVH